MWDEEGNSLGEAPHPMQKVLVRVVKPVKPVKPYDLMRKEKGAV
ncbi:U32 family peptidase C-terminal domain-containing protein [Brevibacillus borstelensis]